MQHEKHQASWNFTSKKSNVGFQQADEKFMLSYLFLFLFSQSLSIPSVLAPSSPPSLPNTVQDSSSLSACSRFFPVKRKLFLATVLPGVPFFLCERRYINKDKMRYDLY